MDILSEAEYRERAQLALRKVFIGDNPFEPVFASSTSIRKIIYRYKYEITSPLTNALIEAASSLGDSGCYFSRLRRSTGDQPPANHCYIAFSEFNSVYVEKERNYYDEIGFFFIVENVLYSPQGKWGLMLSHEGHGLLGGSPEFMEIICSIIPDLNQQVYEFLNYWQYCKANYPDCYTAWLPDLLSHIYGSEIASLMLKEAGLS